MDVILENRPMPVGKLCFEDYIWKKENACFIGTMPRSGTNLLVYFFDFLHQAILGSLDENDPQVYKLVHGGWDGTLEESLDSRFCLVSHNFAQGLKRFIVATIDSVGMAYFWIG